MKKTFSVFLALVFCLSLFSVGTFAKQELNIIDISYSSITETALKSAIDAAAQTAEDDLIILHTNKTNNEIELSSPLVVNIGSNYGALTIEADNGVTIKNGATVVIDLQKGSLSLKKTTLIGNFSLQDGSLYTIREGENTSLQTENCLYLINYENKYFSAEFRIAEPDEWAYITGLTLSEKDSLLLQVKELQKDGTMTNASLIDANKIWSSDFSLCWAASASNALYYSGWAEKSGIDFATKYDYTDQNTGEFVDFSASDGILRYFAENFEDNAGNGYFGTQWFINGLYPPSEFAEEFKDQWSQLKKNSTGGALFGNMLFENYIGFSFLSSRDTFNNNFTKAQALLRSFYAVTLSVSFYHDNPSASPLGGHAITLWGYTYDKTLSPEDKGYLTSYYITDSDDSYVNEQTVVVNYPKKMQCITLVWSDDFSSYISTTYLPGRNTVIDEFSCILPVGEVKDTASSHVTTDASGLDATDGQTSFEEAITYSELFGTDVTFDESLAGKTIDYGSSWYFASDMLIDASNLAAPVTLRCTPSTKAPFIFNVLDGFNVTIKNVGFVAADSSVECSAFIIDDGGRLSLNSCEISGFNAEKGSAIYCKKGSHFAIGDGCIIAENTVSDSSEKSNIYLEYGATLSVEGTDSSNIKAGITLSNYNPGYIFGNSERSNKDGSLYFDGKQDYFIDYNEKTFNLFVNTSSLGDITDDEKITIEDAILLFMYVAGKAQLSSEQMRVADYNSDSFADISDAILLFSTVAGKTNG